MGIKSSLKKVYRKLFKKNAPKSQREINREKCIESTMEKTGWTRSKAVQEVDGAHKRLGIGYLVYDNNDFWKLSPEEQDEKISEIREKRAARQLQKYMRDRAVRRTAKSKLITRKQAREYVDKIVAEYGIDYRTYQQGRLFRCSVEELPKAVEVARETVAEFNRQYEAEMKYIMDRYGVKRYQVQNRFTEVNRKYHMRWSEFYEMDAYGKNNDVLSTFLVLNDFKQLQKKYKQEVKLVKYTGNKIRCLEMLDRWIKRSWTSTQDLTYERFIELFGNAKGVVYKPLDGQHGVGVKAYYLDDDKREVYDELSKMPEGVLEGLVIQHPEMNRLNPGSVNCIRITTLSHNSQAVLETGEHFDVVYASIKIGGGSSIADNLIQGGVTAVIDLDTGVVCTEPVDIHGLQVHKHPGTGEVIKGFKVPYFKEAVELTKEIVSTLRFEGLLGWDVAISENGPEIIELNANPGSILYQAAYAPDNIGVKNRIKRYYWEL